MRSSSIIPKSSSSPDVNAIFAPSERLMKTATMTMVMRRGSRFRMPETRGRKDMRARYRRRVSRSKMASQSSWDPDRYALVSSSNGAEVPDMTWDPRCTCTFSRMVLGCNSGCRSLETGIHGWWQEIWLAQPWIELGSTLVRIDSRQLQSSLESSNQKCPSFSDTYLSIIERRTRPNS